MYNASGTYSVTEQLDNKETPHAIELREAKDLCVSEVAWFVCVVAFLLMLCNEAIKVDIRGKVRHVLAEIVVGVHFKDFDLHLLDVFDIHKHLYLFIDLIGGLVVVTHLDVCGILQLLNDILCLIVIINF